MILAAFAPWEWLLSLLGTLLSFYYDLLPEYGIAIILLTLTVMLLMFPLTVKQTRSMKAMQEIQPEVKRLQKEYKGNKEELNKHLMELYKERGVNPAAGCLPLLVQMPIWFALYRVLWQGFGIPQDSTLKGVLDAANSALYVTDATGNLTGTLKPGIDIASPVFEHVRFLGMNLLVRPSQAVDFGDLIGALPYILLIAVIVVAGFYQQVQTMRRRKDDPKDQQQTQMQGMQNVMKVMPIVFGFITWNFVTGLGLYFATSNLFRVGQQAIILRMGDDDGPRGDSDAADTVPDPDPEEPKPGGPSPNASKKRNRKRRK
ncbi:MAG: YidC/Oxa1 family membrane protein insertase [Acidimicrobiia bacterium]